MKTWYNSEIFMNFDQTASNIFVNNIYIYIYIYIYAIFVENNIYTYIYIYIYIYILNIFRK